MTVQELMALLSKLNQGKDVMELAFDMGFDAGASGKVYSNPFDISSSQYTAFYSGWNSGQSAGLAG